MSSSSSAPFSRTVLRFVSLAALSFGAFSLPAHAQDSPPADTSATPADAAPVETPDAGAAPADASVVPADASAAPADASATGDAAAAAGDQTPTSPEATASQPYAETVPVEQTAGTQEAPAEGSKDATKLEKVEVTGSRIKRTDYETAQPVTSISRKDIERTGMISLGDLLQQLPSAGSALNTTFNNGGTGATEIDLRNLGCQRVLVLVNGHRWVNGVRSLATNCVDLNTIPISIIERIEILQDGASAIYGSDAVAGVINIITRKDFQGGQLSLQGGAYTEGADGAQQNHSLSFGDIFGSGAGHTALFGNIGFEDMKAIPTGDREISRLPKENTGLTRGSSFLPTGRFLFIPNFVNGPILGTEKCPSLAGEIVNGALDDNGVPAPIRIPTATGEQIPAVQLCDITHITGAPSSPLYTDYRRYTPPGDNYNYAQDNLVSTPLQTISGFFTINHKFDTLELGVLHDLTFNMEGLYTYRKSRQMLAPQPLCIGNLCPIIGGGLDENGRSLNQRTYIPADQQYNPFRQDLGRADPADPTNIGCDANGTGDNCQLGVVGQGALLFRPTQLGRRIQEQSLPTFFVRPNLSGAIDIFTQMLNWEVGFAYGQSRQSNHLYNSIRLDHLALGVGDPAVCASTPGCVPIDYLHGPSLTQQMIDYIRFTGSDVTKQTQQDAFINLSLSLENIWPFGPIGIATGFEYRKDHYTFTPDEFSQSGISAGLFSQPTDGSVSAKEEFLELDIPLLRDLPLIKELEIDVAGRMSQYQAFGSSRNGKAGIRYKPYDDLLLRGTYSSSFRAPNVGDLFLGQSQSFPILADPCVPGDESPRQPGNNTDVNCNADGVTDEVDQPNAQVTSPFVGNPDLKPETSHSWSAGLVFSPSFIRGLDITVDFFRIYLNNFITPVDPQFVLDSCYSNDPQHRNFCEEVQRDPNNNNRLVLVYSRFQNFAKVVTGGVDFYFGYTLPTPDNVGRFKLSSSATFLSSYDQYLPGTTGEIEKQGLTGINNGGDNIYPRWKINPTLTWTMGGLEATWNTRIVWHVMESCFDGLEPSLVDLGLCSDPNHLAADGSPDPQNKMRTVAKHDVQLAYKFAPQRLTIGVGANNVFNTDPPTAYSAFANSFDASDYWMPGTLIYAKIQKEW